MADNIQLDLFGESAPQEFDRWVHSPGGRHVASDLFRIAARYAARYQRTRRQVSMKLLWELERDQIAEVRRRLKERGIPLAPWKGYALNNNFHSHMARMIEDRRPDWKGLFERREMGKAKHKGPVFIREATVIQRAG